MEVDADYCGNPAQNIPVRLGEVRVPCKPPEDPNGLQIRSSSAVRPGRVDRGAAT